MSKKRRIQIHVDCDCGATFKVKPPKCYIGSDLNSFDLSCPYCGGDLGLVFHIQAKGAVGDGLSKPKV